MRNDAYWERRFAQLEEAANADARAVVAETMRQFRAAEHALDEKINSWYGRFAENNKISMAEARKWLRDGELEEFKWDVGEYIRKGKENAVDQRWMKELENASARFHISRYEALKMETQGVLEGLYAGQRSALSDQLKKEYLGGYYHTAFAVQRGLGIGWDIAAVNESALRRVLSKPWTADGRTFSDRIWTNQAALTAEVHAQLTQNLLLGRGPDAAIDTIAKKFGTSRSNAERLVLTESAYFSSLAQGEAYVQMGIAEYFIIATLDDRTSVICQDMDGRIFEVKDYSPGSSAPPFHARCRSTTAPRIGERSGQRAARAADGKTCFVPANIQYADWKRIFVDGGGKKGLREGVQNGIIKRAGEAASIAEAEAFARDVLGVAQARYTGVDVQTANAWNQGLADTFGRFPELREQFGFVGECHARNAALKPTLQEHYLAQLKAQNPGIPEKTLLPHADTRVKKYMRALRVSKETYAQSYSPSIGALRAFNGVTVNRDWGGDAERFRRMLARDVKDGFHPLGCDSIRSVLDHEIGHQLDRWLKVGEQESIRALYDGRAKCELAKELSRYAVDNGSANRYAEMIAEGWAEYCNNEKPREIAKTIGTTIERLYAEWKKRSS